MEDCRQGKAQGAWQVGSWAIPPYLQHHQLLDHHTGQTEGMSKAARNGKKRERRWEYVKKWMPTAGL